MCAVVFGKRFSYDDKMFIQILEILKEFIGFFLSAPGMVCQLYVTLQARFSLCLRLRGLVQLVPSNLQKLEAF